MSTTKRIVTVVVFPPKDGGSVKTYPFDEVDPAVEKFDDLSLELTPDHNLQIWDTGYKIKEGAGRAHQP